MSEKKIEKIVGVKGMNDMLPSDAPLWEILENTVQSVLKAYGFQQIRTPIVEPTGLFARGLGEVTDIVEKEMYSFQDSLNGDQLTLRPEGTAGVVRAAIEHNLVYDGPKRLWYVGPMFRHEKPQRGRYRQFHQFGVEALGFSGPDIDAEMILMCQRLWDDLGLQNIRLEINSIGDAEERNRHRAALIEYFEKHAEQLDEDAKRRLYSNPLRILDTKNPSMQELVNAAPKLMEYLGEESMTHFNGVQAILNANNVPFKINARLVRGMDYYNRTVFEWVTDELGAQGTVCGGGRYDSLFSTFGGKFTPACGFAMGIERLLELLKISADMPASAECDVYLVHQSDVAQLQAIIAAERMRDAGINAIVHCSTANGRGSFKSQMKKADSSGATYAVIIGEDELASGNLTVKALRAENPETNQISVSAETIVDYLIEQLTEAGDDCCDDPDHIHLH
ncbi:histidine--tRNA ligase [Undibacterium luofuense]|uniref:Histidine--tRNA ligase n=1 Tax=Undibacterium luofuense TaxID=2828733 RepID=A0A941I6S6_9BURK|nr:histidine--tRNA ligase [Undibacterium luofuense]MBR7782996.1 histidine--tRNA ligase [Undibacterium luofuense]